MRKVLTLLMAVLFCGCVSLSYADDDLKVGFINLKKVLDGYRKVKDGEDELLEEAEQKNEKREKLIKEIKRLREKIDLLKDKQKEKKQRELNGKVKKLQDLTYEMRTSLRQKRDEKFIDIIKEVKAVMEEYGSSRNYDFIIEGELLHYKSKKLNVTDDIIKILNQR